jgi:hypothetical protein
MNMTHNSVEPTTRVSWGLQNTAPLGWEYEHHWGCYRRFEMFPLQQFPRQGPLSTGAPNCLQHCWETIQSIGQRLFPALLFHLHHLSAISNNPSFHVKHPGVQDGSDGSDGTSYHLTGKYTLPVTLAMGHVAYSPPLLCAWYTHHYFDRCVTLFAGAAVML